MNSSIAALLQEGRQLHRQGALDAAEQRYRQALQLAPDHAETLYYLALVAYQRGKVDEAIALAQRAVTADPAQARAHRLLGQALNRLGRRAEALASLDRAIAGAPGMAAAHGARADVLMDMGRTAEALQGYDRALMLEPASVSDWCSRAAALEDLGRYDEAIASYDKAIALEPDFPDAHFNRGHALMQAKRFDEALASYDRSLALGPGNPEALNNRGLVLNRLKRDTEALAAYDQALRIKPDHVGALTNRGVTLKTLRRFEDALASYDRALAISPGQTETICNRGHVLIELKRFDEALAAYDRALAAQPDSPDAWCGRGNALAGLRRLDEGLAAYDRALAIKPDHADALNCRGFTLHELMRAEEALASYDRALAVRPDHAAALHNRGLALEKLKRGDEALASYDAALAADPTHRAAFSGVVYSTLKICDWPRTERLAREMKAEVESKNAVVDPFALLIYSDDPALHLEGVRNYVADKIPAVPRIAPHAARRTDGRLRIAYVSADFHRHATAFLMAELFGLHDRARFEVSGISFGPDDGSDMRARLIKSFDRFHDVRLKSDRDIAMLLHEHEIDIAIDLKSYTEDSRPQIFSYRPAPIQVSYLGYPGTMGADFIDYVIADKVVLPLDQQPFYTERIVQLPDCYQVNDSKRVIAPRTPTRREVGLPDQGFVFCSFNNNYKIAPAVFDVWMRLLAAVEGSVLWLLRDNPTAETNLRKQAAARGIDPARLVFAGRLPLEEHLARHRLADLFLDTLPYNAHTTASDALWAGLPVVTCPGRAFAARVAASLLHAIGLPELVTPSPAEYEALALRLAREPAQLQAIRQKLERNRLTHPLFDTNRFRRHLESAYLTMWERHRRGEPPQSFAVDAIGP